MTSTQWQSRDIKNLAIWKGERSKAGRRTGREVVRKFLMDNLFLRKQKPCCHASLDYFQCYRWSHSLVNTKARTFFFCSSLLFSTKEDSNHVRKDLVALIELQLYPFLCFLSCQFSKWPSSFCQLKQPKYTRVTFRIAPGFASLLAALSRRALSMLKLTLNQDVIFEIRLSLAFLSIMVNLTEAPYTFMH